MQMSDYQILASETGIYPPGCGLFYPVIGLAGEVGEVCEKIKKVYRDDGGILKEEKRQALKGELGDVLWYLSAVASDLNLDLSEIAEANIEKLQSRKAKGVLHGSGDNR